MSTPGAPAPTSAWLWLDGGNPVPGDAAAAGELQRRVAESAQHTDESIRTLEAIGAPSGSAWSGPAATAFRNHVLEELLHRLRDVRDAYRGVADALTIYVGELQQHQQEASEIAARADRINAGGPVPGTAAYTAMYTTTATTGVPVAPPPALQQVQHDRDALASRASASAQRCATAIRSAMKPVKAYERSTMQKIGSKTLDAMEVVNDALSEVNATLSVLALLTMPIPGVGTVVNLTNVAVNLTLLTTNVVLATQDRRTWGQAGSSLVDVGFDAAGLGAARMSGKAAKTVEATNRGAARGARESAEAQRTVARQKEALAKASGRPAELEVRGLRNDAALDDARAALHDEAAQRAGQRAPTGIRDGFGVLDKKVKNGATQESLLRDWQVPPGEAGRAWQTTEVVAQGLSTTKSGLEADPEPPPRTPAPTGWRG